MLSSGEVRRIRRNTTTGSWSETIDEGNLPVKYILFMAQSSSGYVVQGWHNVDQLLLICENGKLENNRFLIDSRDCYLTGKLKVGRTGTKGVNSKLSITMTTSVQGSFNANTQSVYIVF